MFSDVKYIVSFVVYIMVYIFMSAYEIWSITNGYMHINILFA